MKTWDDIFGVHKSSILSENEYNILKRVEEDKILEKAIKIKKERKQKESKDEN